MYCTICFENTDTNNPFYSFESCNHAFCFDCIKEYLKIQISEANLSIVCPDISCKNILQHNEIKSIISILIENFDLDKNFDEKYEQYMLNSYLKEQKVKWCPNKKCSKPIITNNDNSENDNFIINCAYCNYRICSNCFAEEHPEMSCDNYKQFAGKVNSVEDWKKMKGDSVKNCPNCNFCVEKISGCDHMFCTNCHNHYCWKCERIVINSELNFHFDARFNICRPPYKNKLMKLFDKISYRTNKINYNLINYFRYSLSNPNFSVGKFILGFTFGLGVGGLVLGLIGLGKTTALLQKNFGMKGLFFGLVPIYTGLCLIRQISLR